MRDASVGRGIGVLPMFVGVLGLLLLIESLPATWAREGRSEAVSDGCPRNPPPDAVLHPQSTETPAALSGAAFLSISAPM